jgi:hypothetical protein
MAATRAADKYAVFEELEPASSQAAQPSLLQGTGDLLGSSVQHGSVASSAAHGSTSSAGRLPSNPLSSKSAAGPAASVFGNDDKDDADYDGFEAFQSAPSSTLPSQSGAFGAQPTLPPQQSSSLFDTVFPQPVAPASAPAPRAAGLFVANAFGETHNDDDFGAFSDSVPTNYNTAAASTTITATFTSTAPAAKSEALLWGDAFSSAPSIPSTHTAQPIDPFAAPAPVPAETIDELSLFGPSTHMQDESFGVFSSASLPRSPAAAIAVPATLDVFGSAPTSTQPPQAAVSDASPGLFHTAPVTAASKEASSDEQDDFADFLGAPEASIAAPAPPATQGALCCFSFAFQAARLHHSIPLDQFSDI